MRPLIENPVLKYWQQQQDQLRKIVDTLNRNPVLDMLERQRKQQEMMWRALRPNTYVIDALNRPSALRLFDDAQRTAQAVVAQADTWVQIQEWLEAQAVILEEAAKAKEEGREFDLEAFGGPKMGSAAVQNWLALIAVILQMFQILTDDGITAIEQRAISDDQTAALIEADEEQTKEITEAIARQTKAFKEALESHDRPELHITVEKGGKLVVKDGEVPPVVDDGKQSGTEENSP